MQFIYLFFSLEGVDLERVFFLVQRAKPRIGFAAPKAERSRSDVIRSKGNYLVFDLVQDFVTDLVSK